MSISDCHLVKKQCNIGKHQAYSGEKIHDATKQDFIKTSILNGTTLRQTNISHYPLLNYNVSRKFAEHQNHSFETISTSRQVSEATVNTSLHKKTTKDSDEFSDLDLLPLKLKKPFISPSSLGSSEISVLSDNIEPLFCTSSKFCKMSNNKVIRPKSKSCFFNLDRDTSNIKNLQKCDLNFATPSNKTLTKNVDEFCQTESCCFETLSLSNVTSLNAGPQFFPVNHSLSTVLPQSSLQPVSKDIQHDLSLYSVMSDKGPTCSTVELNVVQNDEFCDLTSLDIDEVIQQSTHDQDETIKFSTSVESPHYLNLSSSNPSLKSKNVVTHLPQSDSVDHYDLNASLDEDNEEDVLHSSLNHLSCDSSKLVLLGKSIKVLKLTRIMSKLNEEERNKVMSLYRYFFKWKNNARLLRILRIQQLDKLSKADNHYAKQLVLRYFFRWFNFINAQKSLAESFNRKHALAKGVSAFRWLILKCHERYRELSWCNQQKALAFVFRLWRQRCIFLRLKRQQEYFRRWKKQYYHCVVSKIFKEKFSNEIVIKYYLEWRKKFEVRQQLHLASLYYYQRKKKACFETWRLYSADRMVRCSRMEIASLQYRTRFSRKLFNVWKVACSKTLHAKQHNHTMILRRSCDQWMRAVYYLKIRHKRQHCSALEFRSKARAAQSWGRWKRQLWCARHIKLRQSSVLRSAFLLWAAEKNQKVFFGKLVSSFESRSLLRRHLRLWRIHISAQHERRFQACGVIHRVSMRQIFTTWWRVAEQKRHTRDMVEGFRQSRGRKYCREVLRIWARRCFKIITERNAVIRRRFELARVVAGRWMLFVARRRRKRSCDHLERKLAYLRLKGCLETWRVSLRKVIAKQRRAELHCDKVANQKRRIMIREWHKLTEESLFMKPLIRRSQHRICTRYFDAWRCVVVRKRYYNLCIKKIARRKTMKLFGVWIDRMLVKEEVEDLRRVRDEKLVIRVLLAWLSFVTRQANLERLRIILRSRTALVCLHHWRKQAQQRRLAFEESLRREREDLELLSRCFERWSGEVGQMVALRSKAASMFARDRNFRLKKSALKSWMTSLEYVRRAERFRSLGGARLALMLFRGWRSVTITNLHNDVILFSSSLQSASSSSDDLPVSSHATPPFPVSRNLVYDPTTDSGLDMLPQLSGPSSFTATQSFDYSALSFAPHSAIGRDFSPHSSYPSTTPSSVESCSPAVLSVNDLRFDYDDTSVSSDDSRIVTQREVVSCVKKMQLACLKKFPSRPVVPDIRRPRGEVDILLTDSNPFQLEALVRFSIHRICSPLLSIAFHQWKLSVRISRWKKDSTAFAHNLQEEWAVRIHFKEWRRRMMDVRRVDEHSSRIRKIYTLRCWKTWRSQRERLRRLEAAFTARRNHSTMKECFHCWISSHKQRLKLKESLALWKKKSFSRMINQPLDIQRHRDEVLLRHCFLLWRVKLMQMRQCDDFHRCCVRRKFLRFWNLAAEEEAAKKRNLSQVTARILKRRILLLWQRKLHAKENAERLRSQVLSSWLVNLLTRWHTFAKGSHQRRTALQGRVNVSNQREIEAHFKKWRECVELKKLARAFREKLLLTSYFSSMRHLVARKKKRLRDVTIRKQHREMKMMTSCFKVWKRAYSLNFTLEQHLIRKQRKMIEMWSIERRNRVMRRIGIRLNLQCHFILWRIYFEENRKQKELLKKVIHKWRCFTAHKKNLNKRTNLFVASQSLVCVHSTFDRWRKSTTHAMDARFLYHRSLTTRVVRAWRGWRCEQERARGELDRFLRLRVARSVASTWERWRRHSERSVRHQAIVDCIIAVGARRRKRHAWLLWKQRARVERALRHRKMKMQRELFLLWLLRLKWRKFSDHVTCQFRLTSIKRHLASSFVLWKTALHHRHATGEFRNHLMKKRALARWKLWRAGRVERRRGLLHVIGTRRRAALEAYFTWWRERTTDLQELAFVADEVRCGHQVETMRRCWLIWTKQKQSHDLLLRSRQSMVVTQWRCFVRDRVDMRVAESQYIINLKKQFLMVWIQKFKAIIEFVNIKGLVARSEYNVYNHIRGGKCYAFQSFIQDRFLLQIAAFSRRHNDYVTHKTFHCWFIQSSMLQIASEYHRSHVVGRVWSAWRLRHALMEIDRNVIENVNRDLLRRVFGGWRVLASNPAQGTLKSTSRIPRLRRR